MMKNTYTKTGNKISLNRFSRHTIIGGVLKAISLILMVCICGAESLFAQAALRTVESKVVAATVFKKGALISREGQVTLKQGTQTLCFSNLPESLLDKSVTVSIDNQSGATILDVNVNQRHTTETQQERVKKLEQKIAELQQAKLQVEDEQTVLSGRKSFIESIKPQQPRIESAKTPDYQTYLKQWTDAITYLNDNLNTTLKQMHDNSVKLAGIQSKISQLNEEIKNSSGVFSRNFKEIVVNVASAKEQRITITVRYSVPDADWTPAYDARVNSADRINELTYFGILKQATGEDWKDISLELSTAEPNTMKSIPELGTWFVDLYPIGSKNASYQAVNTSHGVTFEQNWGLPQGKGTISGYVTDDDTGEPLAGCSVILDGINQSTSTDGSGRFFLNNVPAKRLTLKFSFIGYKPMKMDIQLPEKNNAIINAPLHSESVRTAEVMVIAERPILNKNATNSTSTIEMNRNDFRNERPKPREREKYSNVSNTELTTSFTIPTKYTIPSDMEPHKVTIAIEEMVIAFERTAIPKLTQKVFSRGKISNNNKYPWLSGKMNVFIDNEFLNTTSMGTIVPGDSLLFTLGNDDLMKIERKLISSKKEAPSVFGSKIAQTFVYEIVVSNSRKTEETITISDQLPISSDEQIEIIPVEPSVSLKTLNDSREITWHLTLKPGEKRTIPFSFQVRFPKEIGDLGF